MQREEGHLDRQTDEDEHDRGVQRPVALALGQQLGDVGHVESPRDRVGETDAEQQKHRADGADHQVAEAGQQRPPATPEGDQRVGRQRADLEEHERVEGVPRDGETQQPAQREAQARVERRRAVGVDLGGDAAPAVDRGDRGDERHEQQDGRVEAAHHELDAGR